MAEYILTNKKQDILHRAKSIEEARKLAVSSLNHVTRRNVSKIQISKLNEDYAYIPVGMVTIARFNGTTEFLYFSSRDKHFRIVNKDGTLGPYYSEPYVERIIRATGRERRPENVERSISGLRKHYNIRN